MTISLTCRHVCRSMAEGSLYFVAACFAGMGVYLPLRPQSVGFFAIQASLWCVASGAFVIARRRAWQRCHGGAEGDPPEWSQALPAWTFDSSACVMILTNVPFLLAMAPRCFASSDAFRAAHSQSYMASSYPEDFWLEHLIYSSLFGFMIRDMLLHIHNPDLLFTIHHICVCFLMVGVSFWEIHGFRLLAFTTAVVELGSASFSLWVLYRWQRQYVLIMTASNLVWMFCACACTIWHSATSLQIVMCSVGVSMAVARQAYMLREVWCPSDMSMESAKEK